jgi:hypothetical protein
VLTLHAAGLASRQHDALGGRVSLDFISGNAQICDTTKLFVGLVDGSAVPKFARLMSPRRTLAHVHIDDPTGGHIVYDLDAVVITGERLPPAVPQPTFTLTFGGITVTGCGQRREVGERPGRRER